MITINSRLDKNYNENYNIFRTLKLNQNCNMIEKPAETIFKTRGKKKFCRQFSFSVRTSPTCAGNKTTHFSFETK